MAKRHVWIVLTQHHGVFEVCGSRKKARERAIDYVYGFPGIPSRASCQCVYDGPHSFVVEAARYTNASATVFRAPVV